MSKVKKEFTDKEYTDTAGCATFDNKFDNMFFQLAGEYPSVNLPDADDACYGEGVYVAAWIFVSNEAVKKYLNGEYGE